MANYLTQHRQLALSEETINRLIDGLEPFAKIKVEFVEKTGVKNKEIKEFYLIGNDLVVYSESENGEDMGAIVDEEVYSKEKGFSSTLSKYIDIERENGQGCNMIIRKINVPEIDDIKFPVHVRRDNIDDISV